MEKHPKRKGLHNIVRYKNGKIHYVLPKQDKKCRVCGQPTDGFYGNEFPVCWECYDSLKLKTYLEENNLH